MFKPYRLLPALLFWLLAGLAGAQEAPLPVQEVAPGVFVHLGEIALMSEENEGGTANLGFVIGTAAVAVIDTGGSVKQGRRLLAAVREETDLPLAYVVNTHGHPDHAFGNAAFADGSTTLLGHQQLPAFLAARGEHYLRSFSEPLGKTLIKEIRIVPPSETVEKQRILDLGGRLLQVDAWPTAHSEGDLTVFDTKSGTLFAGDLVFVEHIPVVDGSLLGFLATAGELTALPAKQVVPGHGPVSAWPAAARAQRDYLEALIEDLRRQIAAGTPLERAVETAGQEQARQWALQESYHQRNATAGYVELEWE